MWSSCLSSGPRGWLLLLIASLVMSSLAPLLRTLFAWPSASSRFFALFVLCVAALAEPSATENGSHSSHVPPNHRVHSRVSSTGSHPSARARWVAQCAALPPREVRTIAVRDRGLDPQLAEKHALHLRFVGWALPHLWLWGGVNATCARYLAIPKAGSSSVRKAMGSEYGLRSASGAPWASRGGMFAHDGSHNLKDSQRSWFGWTLVADPVSHFIGGWSQVSGDRAVGLKSCMGVQDFLNMLQAEATLPNSTALATTTHMHNVHLAPQLHIIRSAIAQFVDSPEQTAISFVAHLSNVSNEWRLLRREMKAAGARPFAGELPRVDFKDTSKCRAGMGILRAFTVRQRRFPRPRCASF